MREHWSLDPDLVYLNHGSFGAVPRVTQEAQQQLQAAAEANPMRWFRDLPARLVRTRERIGRYLGASGVDLALVPNATTGVNVALRSLGSSPGGRLVLTNHAYGAVLLAARRVAAERRWDLDIVDVSLDATDEEIVAAVEATVTTSTIGIVVDQISSATAKVFPAAEVAALGHRLGIPVVVDGAHTPALLDEAVVGDFWTGNLHKWPCAPRGCGVLYVAPARHGEVVPPVVSWWDPMGFPLSMDYPGTTDATGWLAASTSLDLMETLGFAEERKRLGELATTGAELVAEAIGGAVVDVCRPAPVMRLVALPEGLVSDDVEAGRLQTYLAPRTGTEVAITAWDGRGFLRLGAHLYNTVEDFHIAAARLAPHFADPVELGRLI